MKALASDLDGTLVFRELDNLYKAGDLEAIHQFQKDGNLFGCCTGRPLESVGELAELNLDFYLMSSGAVILDKDLNVIEHHPINKDLARKIFDTYKDVAFLRVLQTNNFNKFFGTHDEFKNPNFSLIKEFDDVTDEYIYSVSLIFKTEQEALDTNEDIKKKFPMVTGHVNRNSIDVTSIEASKGIATQKIKKLFGIDLVGGIGDSYNDLSMIKDADIGFTFDYSPMDIQKQADYVVSQLKDAIIIMNEQ